jgi:hypothetical protein
VPRAVAADDEPMGRPNPQLLTGRDIEQIRQRHTLAADPRDLLAARDSLKQLLGISQLDT